MTLMLPTIYAPPTQIRRKSWFGTDNSYSRKKTSFIKNALENDPQVVRAIVSIEQGNNAKKPHYQFYIERKSAMTRSAMQKKFFAKDKAHLQKRKGTPWEAWTYCSPNKDDGTHIRLLVQIGVEPPETYTKKAATVWDDIYERISAGATMWELRKEFTGSVPRYHKFIEKLLYERDIVEFKNKFRTLTVEWWHGPPRTGKTRKAMSLVEEPHLIHRISDYRNPWDSYEGQEYVLLDEFHGQVPLASMLQWLDNYYPELSCRYNNKIGKYHTVIICSNHTFDEIYRPPSCSCGQEDCHHYVKYAYEGREQSVEALLHRINTRIPFGADKPSSNSPKTLDDFGL